MTLIAGYLGSGKTTLLNHLIARCDTSRFAILVNDFGALNIDAELVELEGGKAYRLESGCICCNIGNSLMTTLLALLRQEPRPERIVIEASGVADPARIADIARLSPSLHPGRVVVLVDGRKIRTQLADPLVGETVRRQLQAAELIVLNKADLLAEVDLAGITDWLRAQFGKRLLTASQADIPVTEVLAEPVGRPGPDHDVDTTSIEHGEVFWSWSYEKSLLFERQALEEALLELVPLVIRAKGFVRFQSTPDRPMIVQMSGTDIAITDVENETSELPICRLQFIGAGRKPNEAMLCDILERAARAAPVGKE